MPASRALERPTWSILPTQTPFGAGQDRISRLHRLLRETTTATPTPAVPSPSRLGRVICPLPYPAGSKVEQYSPHEKNCSGRFCGGNDGVRCNQLGSRGNAAPPESSHIAGQIMVKFRDQARQPACCASTASARARHRQHRRPPHQSSGRQGAATHRSLEPEPCR